MREKRRKKMNAKLLIGIVLVGVILLSGCTGKPSYSDTGNGTANSPSEAAAPAAQEKPTVKVLPVATLDLWMATMENWDEDPEADGIEATIAPRDKDDKMQYAEGVVNAKVYTRSLNTSTYKYEKGELVKEWSNVPITKDQYGFLGAPVRLEFDSAYTPTDALYLEIEFVYNGKTYKAIKDSVFDLG